MLVAFDQLFQQLPATPWRIFSDRGTEFEAKDVKKWLSDRGVEKTSANNKEIKASLAERMIQNVKHRLYKYFTHYKTLKWIDVVPKITQGINNAVCRTTGMKPAQVNFENAQQLWKKLYANAYGTERRTKLNAGDSVRVARERKVFDKGYLPTFSNITFGVNKVLPGNPHLYRLQDQAGRPIGGKWYREEVTRAAHEPDFKIEKIVKSRTSNNGKEYLIKWVNQPAASNSWVSEKDLLLLE